MRSPALTRNSVLLEAEMISDALKAQRDVERQ